MARPKNQHARRSELVSAAKHVIVDRGLAGLRVKDVAARARVSPGTVAYYYPELEELIKAVHRDEVDRFYWARLSEVAEIEDPKAKLKSAIRSGVPRGRYDIDFQVLNELHTHAHRNEYHARLMAELHENEVSFYESVLADGVRRGSFVLHLQIVDVARTLVALEDAYGLHILGGTPLSSEDAYRLISATAEVLTGCILLEDRYRGGEGNLSA